MVEFPAHPGRVSASQGLRVALRLMVSSWRVWLSAIAALAALAFAFRALVGAVDVDTLFTTDQATGRVSMAPGQEGHVLVLLGGGAFLALLGAMGGWVFSGLAIAGLRPGRRLTAAWVAGRGLLTFAYAALVGLVAVSAFVALAVVAALSPTSGAILLLLVGAAGLYAFVRLIFVTLLIFDGRGPIEAVRESWRLSDGSVARLAGWVVMVVLIGEGLSLLLGPTVALVAASGSAPAAEAVSGAFAMVAATYSTFFMAVLYESQRARAYPALYPQDQASEMEVSPRVYEQSAAAAQRWLASQRSAAATVSPKAAAPRRRARRRRKSA